MFHQLFESTEHMMFELKFSDVHTYTDFASTSTLKHIKYVKAATACSHWALKPQPYESTAPS